MPLERSLLLRPLYHAMPASASGGMSGPATWAYGPRLRPGFPGRSRMRLADVACSWAQRTPTSALAPGPPRRMSPGARLNVELIGDKFTSECGCLGDVALGKLLPAPASSAGPYSGSGASPLCLYGRQDIAFDQLADEDI